MPRSTLLRTLNSLECISLLVLLAVIVTTLVSSVQTERDARIRQESLNHSHLQVVEGAALVARPAARQLSLSARP
jgi:hypothetical protein